MDGLWWKIHMNNMWFWGTISLFQESPHELRTSSGDLALKTVDLSNKYCTWHSTDCFEGKSRKITTRAHGFHLALQYCKYMGFCLTWTCMLAAPRDWMIKRSGVHTMSHTSCMCRPFYVDHTILSHSTGKYIHTYIYIYIIYTNPDLIMYIVGNTSDLIFQ